MIEMYVSFIIILLAGTAIIGTAAEYWLLLKETRRAEKLERRIENLENVVKMYVTWRKPKRWEWKGDAAK